MIYFSPIDTGNQYYLTISIFPLDEKIDLSKIYKSASELLRRFFSSLLND